MGGEEGGDRGLRGRARRDVGDRRERRELCGDRLAIGGDDLLRAER